MKGQRPIAILNRSSLGGNCKDLTNHSSASFGIALGGDRLVNDGGRNCRNDDMGSEDWVEDGADTFKPRTKQKRTVIVHDHGCGRDQRVT